METLYRLSYWGGEACRAYTPPGCGDDAGPLAAGAGGRLTGPMSRSPRWTLQDLPDLTGRTAIVTGATSGLGLATAAALAGRGAEVTLAVRDTRRGAAAAEGISSRVPGARLEVGELDLADLASVRAFAEGWQPGRPLDLLVNNAGVMAIPRRVSADGFEMQFATNHLGHFALTGCLLDRIREGGRVVTVSSLAHRAGRIDFDDLMGERRYRAWGAYAQSKLANLLFTRELDRRLSAAGTGVIAVAAHPGYAATNLQAVGPAMTGNRAAAAVMSVANRVLAQSAEDGALPTLYAATLPGLAGGSFAGPGGIGQQRGAPTLVGMSAAARDDAAARRLWQVSEELTGVSHPGVAGAGFEPA